MIEGIEELKQEYQIEIARELLQYLERCIFKYVYVVTGQRRGRRFMEQYLLTKEYFELVSMPEIYYIFAYVANLILVQPQEIELNQRILIVIKRVFYSF